MSSRTDHLKFTYEDYLLFPEDGKRYEIIEGERYVTPAPSTKHQRISRRLLVLLDQYVKDTRKGEVFDAPCDVVLSDLDVVQPDLLYISAARASIITEKNIRGAPDLIIEIVSESTRRTDEVVKRRLYERYGVQEYWIVDPELETVKVYRMSEKGYTRAAELVAESGDHLTSPLLPDLKIPLPEIFE